jgi:hypothetical protein
VSIPRSTIEQLLLRDYARTVRGMDTQALVGAVDALTRTGVITSETPSPTSTPSSRSEQSARTDPEQGKSQDPSLPRQDALRATPDMFRRAQEELLQQQGLKAPRPPSQPLTSTPPNDDASKARRGPPNATSDFPVGSQSVDQTAELLGLRAREGNAPIPVETPSPDDSRVKDAAKAIAGLPLALWQSLDRIFPESMQPSTGMALQDCYFGRAWECVNI